MMMAPFGTAALMPITAIMMATIVAIVVTIPVVAMLVTAVITIAVVTLGIRANASPEGCCH